MDDITTYYLEMTAPSELRAKPAVEGLDVREVEVDVFQYNRFLYEYVGETWQWVDKLSWSDNQWRQWVEQPDLRTWVAYHRGSPAGYFELHRQDEDVVELAYFGLAQPYIGKGFGGYLLSQAVRNAWEWQGIDRVWVHTCSLDHPSALKNYQARGFRVFKTEVTQE